MNRIVLITLLVSIACTKESRVVRKQDGSWNIESIEVYEPNFINNELELLDVINDMGKIVLTNSKNNNKRDDKYPYTNDCYFEDANIPPQSIWNIVQYSDEIYWSIVCTNKENISRIQLMTAGGTNIFNFSTYTIEWINDNEQIWYYNSGDNNGYDNSITYREIWKLIRN
ncbi:hypothetical protein ACFLTE_07015 [Bacteroidota bacterium]